MRGEEITGYTGVTNTDARKENEGNHKIILDPYSRKTAHRKQPCNATTVPVKNPHKKPCSQRKTDAPLQQWIATNTWVSTDDFILPLPHTARLKSAANREESVFDFFREKQL